MMADLLRCLSVPCSWCSLTLADMLRPVSPMYTLPHSQGMR